jgi:hypothetical protein
MSPLTSLVCEIKTSGVIPTVILVGIFPGFNLPLSGDQFVQRIVESVVKALTQSRDVLRFLLGEGLLVSVRRLLVVVCIHFVVSIS